MHPEHKDFPEFRYVAAACSLKLAHAKFKSRNWSDALYHADTALNCVKLLRDQVRSVDIHEQFRDYVQWYKLLPALPPRSKELPPGTDIDSCNLDLKVCNLRLQAGSMVAILNAIAVTKVFLNDTKLFLVLKGYLKLT